MKNYLSEKEAMERLKNSIIKKSKLTNNGNKRILNSLNSKEMKLRKIYKVALETHGGQFEEFKVNHEFSNEVFKLAQDIKGLVERLARFLKERELKGVARIFFKNGRLLLELLLYKCRIDITYSLLTEGLSTQVIVITVSAGGAAGFTISWFSVGASLVAPPLLISTLLIRSVIQQISNQRDYSQFKNMLNKMLDDDELKETIRAFFLEGEVPGTTSIEMKPLDSGQNSVPEHDFSLKSDQTFEEFIKARMEEEFGLVQNPTDKQLEEIIRRKTNKKPKGKTVFFRDFIDEIPDLSDSDIDIIDAEIVNEPRGIKVKNEEL
ncbi:MAG: hypothetical protein LPK26_15275 [Bacillaceae bacterium]|nr:hypothetical protein [Bacillaceae bacterium]